MLVTQLPSESATVKATVGPSAAWSVEAHLLALVHDAINAGNWQRGGRKGTPRPRPLPRPGVADRTRKTVGSSFSTSAFDAVYASARERAADRWTGGEIGTEDE